jgi:threonylcarbamoyladenosine tRNA methylthiotransferase MtaB
MPRLAFKTLGCRLNQAETAQMAASFEALGFLLVPYGESCQVCVIHGCAVTRLAERQSLREVRAAKRLPGHPFVVLAGCAAELKDHAGLADAGADLLAGQADKKTLAGLVARALGMELPEVPAESRLPHFEGHRAWLKVQDGCDFHCTYCIVPSLRGPPVSRPIEDVVREAEGLIQAGFHELVLTGANLGLWREGHTRLPHLIERLAGLPELGRLRLSSIEVSTIEREVIACLAGCDKVCAFLHLPLQSGDDRILAAMGRRYTASRFRDAAEYAVARIPRIGLGTDVIAGFPGEDDASFAATLKLLEDIPFSNIHPFPFSPRPGTRAAAMPHPVPVSDRKARVAALLALHTRQRAAFAARFVGQEVEVLMEGKKVQGCGVGWTREYLEARVAGAPPPRSLVRMRVTGVKGDTLEGSGFGVQENSLT